MDEKVDGLSEIKEDAIENLNLIVKLDEQIADLDNQAYDVYTKKRVGNRNKKFKKTKSRKENRRYSFEEEKYEDSESDGSRVKPNGRIRNLGIKKKTIKLRLNTFLLFCFDMLIFSFLFMMLKHIKII